MSNKVPTKSELTKLLEPWGQTHVLQFWDKLPQAGQQQLARQITEIDWKSLDRLVREYVLKYAGETVPTNIEPAPYYPIAPADGKQKTLFQDAVAKGAELLRGGRVAGFTVAGGQGTRLGYDAPKGTFPISPVKNKTLFQIFAEGILRTQEKYSTTLAWYIMTSPVNDAATREFLDKNAYFGLDPANVMLFPQGTLPAIRLDGKVLLAAPDSMALSPNGHGGALLAMRESGALADMATRGVNHISYWQVDNPLIHAFDPLFIGLHDLVGSEMSCRSLTKTGPFEKLGNFCMVGGRLTVIEYSDMPKELAEKVNTRGELAFRAGSPAIHMLTRDFVERLTDAGLKLPVHRAQKKVPFIDATGTTGTLVEPKEPNAIKLEMFVFDALPMAKQTLILEAKREEQFAPVKNATGVDSVESCRRMMVDRGAAWLETAGVRVPRKPDGSPACVVELSPRRFVDADDVKAAGKNLRSPAEGEEVCFD
ncbi:MAG: hypothetical protein A3K19_33460 [Lentisphaerae bacterium RIFOXYB12_FULL_65_16]|nr:MAG: hypothetical protein A3K18_05945 [Lentisphaerae bacterium RIFOXYA12_64_32]OGV86938.1 MAG: hypothetical protein A3K19_33460 [Lentisphaerae bacterium RIFOXYB12_FULL_65_16]